MLSLKGGLKPEYTVGFGTPAGVPRIESSPTATYLGVLLDPKRSYWDHVLATSKKSNEMYSKLRGLYSANWGMDQIVVKIIYKGVSLPRIAYASEIW